MPLPPLVEPVAALSEAERARTTRHAVLAGLGEIGQRRIAAAHVAVIGAGGLGSPAIQALAAAGVGTLTVIDDDVIELTNLQRQVIHRRADVGAAKVDSAQRVATELSETRVISVRERLTATSADRLLDGAHVVIDGSDTFETREAVASACDRLGIPLVWGTVQEFDAQATVFWSAPPAPAQPVRLRDLYPPSSVGELPTCAQVGVLGALCLQVGAVLATEAIKLISGVGEPLLGRVLIIDALGGRWREVALRAAAAGVPGGGLNTAPAAPTRPAGATVAPVLPAGAEVEVPVVTVAGLAGADVLDVREPDEIARTGLIPGARAIALAAVLADPTAAATGPVVVVCQVGARAERAARALRAAGVDASVLAGGMAAWQRTPV